MLTFLSEKLDDKAKLKQIKEILGFLLSSDVEHVLIYLMNCAIIGFLGFIKVILREIGML